MKLQSMALILLLSTIWGCSEWPESNERKPEKMKKNARIERSERIFYDRLIQEETFVADVEAGDIIDLKITGTEIQNTFSDIYTQQASTTWQQWVPSPSKVPIGRLITRRGHCELYYKDFLGEVKKPIKFSNHFDHHADDNGRKVGLKAKIGEIFYDLEDTVYHSNDDHTLITTFLIRPEMVLDANDLSLAIIPRAPQEIKVGFQKFGHCPNRKQIKFTVDASLDFQFMDTYRPQEYRVSVDIKRSVLLE